MAINKAKLAYELTGLGRGGGGLEKLTILYENKSPRGLTLFAPKVEALFNPHELNFSKSVNWEAAKKSWNMGPACTGGQAFTSVEPETLQLELFFDTYEGHDNNLSIKGALKQSANPVPTLTATDVREYTRKIAELAQVNPELHRPPQCLLYLGNAKIFAGVLAQLDTTFTMFMPDGIPVRATQNCSFIEYDTLAEQRANELHSSDVAKSRVVRRHDTLHSLAAEEYNDPSLWRHIARANNIINPLRELKPGTVVIIPPLRT